MGGHVGLSPPTRGSLDFDSSEQKIHGSIPAHTGKPAYRIGRNRSERVYPRPHGEAVRGKVWAYAWSGLSPPTRGSPWHAGHARIISGSIPAHTGKPGFVATSLIFDPVYPRPHGEAEVRVRVQLGVQGLSPPTRGSRPRRPRRDRRSRSIPAHTGKPLYNPPMLLYAPSIMSYQRTIVKLRSLYKQDAVRVAYLLWRFSKEEETKSARHGAVSPHHGHGASAQEGVPFF